MPAFEARKPFLLEYRLRHADGEYRWFLAAGVPKSTDGTAASPATWDATSTSPNGRRPKIGFSQARRHLRRVIRRRIQYLAGRLIGAQEVERARIARDLHDDVSQQLAGVSIAFSGLKQRLGEYHLSEELEQELVELQRQTRTLTHVTFVNSLTISIRRCCQHLGLVKGLTFTLSRRTRAGTWDSDDVHCGGRFSKTSRRTLRSASTESRRRRCGTSSHTPVPAERM